MVLISEIDQFELFKLILSHVELGKRGLSNEEETGLKRIYRPDYRDPVEKQEEPEVNPADIENDLKRLVHLSLMALIKTLIAFKNIFTKLIF